MILLKHRWAVRSARLLWYAGDIKCLNITDPDQLNSFMQCRMQLAQCRRTPIIIWSLGWLFLAGFSWLPCFYFCCCAKEPPPGYGGDPYMQNGVQVGVTGLLGAAVGIGRSGVLRGDGSVGCLVGGLQSSCGWDGYSWRGLAGYPASNFAAVRRSHRLHMLGTRICKMGCRWVLCCCCCAGGGSGGFGSIVGCGSAAGLGRRVLRLL